MYIGHKIEVFPHIHVKIEWIGFGQVPDLLFAFKGLLLYVNATYNGGTTDRAEDSR